MLLALVAGAAVLVLGAGPASAHPLGNFTVNLYTGLRVSPDQVGLDHVVDLAEIPAFQARQQVDVDGDGTVSAGESRSWRTAECARRGTQLDVTGDGRPLALRVESAALAFPPGVGGLTTLRLECSYAADLDGARSVRLRDDEDAQRIGWHEVTAVGDGTTLRSSDVPQRSTSRRLTAYPQDLLTSPLDQRTATVTFFSGGAPAAAIDHGQGDGTRPVDAAARAYVGLLDRADVTPLFVAGALLLAVLLGGLHALAPGHGKTLMASYLLGAGGRAREALTIAATVTATHTTGVLVLGAVVAGSYATAPERVYPWLSGASGLLALAVGISLLRRVRNGHRHGHGHGHDHDHGPDGHLHGSHGHDHRHPHDAAGHSHGDAPAPTAVALATRTDTRLEAQPAPAAAVEAPSRRSLVALGLAGGMLPSPSALLVLLAGIALHRTWLAIVLVVAYGAGMALTLCGAGLLVLRARGIGSHLPRLAGHRFVRWLPLVAGMVVTLAGAQLVLRALLALT